MKITDMRDLSGDELSAKSNSLSEEYFRLKFKHGIRQLENTAVLRKIRRDIARVETVRSEKVIAASNS
ncbi:MAG: 50S ribosomal protein L29 [Deltaproteobacteria bacterium]|nr:50S ribosomal protein L29 [Deltaproteobacteria bacterium]